MGNEGFSLSLKLKEHGFDEIQIKNVCCSNCVATRKMFIGKCAKQKNFKKKNKSFFPKIGEFVE